MTRLSSHCWDIRQSSETAANTTNTVLSKYTKSERDVYQMPSSIQLFDDQYLPDKRPKLHDETTEIKALNRSTEVAPTARKAYPFSSLSATQAAFQNANTASDCSDFDCLDRILGDNSDVNNSCFSVDPSEVKLLAIQRKNRQGVAYCIPTNLSAI